MEDAKFSFHPAQGELVKRCLVGNNIICVSGRGFGKSTAGRGIVSIDAINYQGYVPPQSVGKLFNVIASPTLQQAKRLNWEILEYIFCETNLKALVKGINKAEGIIQLRGKRPSIMLAGLNDDNGDRLRGLSISKLFIDEAADIRNINNIWAALAPAVARASGSCFVTGTPKGKGTPFHRFLLSRVENGWCFYRYTSADNPTIPNLDKFLEDSRKNLTEREYRSEILASFEDFPGQIFDYLEDRHVIQLEQSPDEYDFTVGGIDYGDVNPCIVIVGIKARPLPYRFFIIDAYMPRDGQTKTFDVVKEKALEFAHKYNLYSWYADPFMPGAGNYAIELSQLGHPSFRRIPLPGSQDYSFMRSIKVMPSSALLNRLFNKDRLFINSRLEHLVNDFRAYRRKQNRFGEILDEPDPSCTEHCIDASRYCIFPVETSLSQRFGLGESYYTPSAA